MNISWLILASIFIIITCGLALIINIYRLVYLDAKSRGIKKPKFWGFISAGAQNGSGLILYLFKRKGYEKGICEKDLKSINKIKKRIGYILFGELIGIIIFILNVILTK